MDTLVKLDHLNVHPNCVIYSEYQKEKEKDQCVNVIVYYYCQSLPLFKIVLTHRHLYLEKVT